MLREELALVKQEEMNLMIENKLFQHYFFNFWKEKSRDVLLEKTYLLGSIIESPANLYNVCEGIAFGEE